MTDTTARTDQESRERLEHQRLTSLINSMADAVIAVDEDIRVVVYNAAALALLDINTINIGDGLTDIFKPVNADQQPQDVKKIVKSARKPITRRDLLVNYADHSTISLYLSVAPVHLGYGTKGLRGYVLVLRDITREKSLEEERDEFISVISHELRTPVAIAEGNIGNALFAVEKSSLSDALKPALEEAHNQVLFLADMINDLSTLSRAERGTLEIASEGINVQELVSELAASYTPEAAAKGLELHTEFAPDLGTLYSSSLYVREILQNFLTNAIKYTQKGHVTLRASVAPQGILFAVEDSGIGIGKGDQAKVYDKFFRSEDYRTREANGTGLGLYVTMKLASLLHAELDLKSVPNEGSTFSVLVPNLKPAV